MSVNRREFIRRISVVSGLLVTGLVSTWELVQSPPQGSGPPAGNSTDILPTIQPPIQPPTQPQPPPTTTAQTVTEQQTVTVTKYVAGPTTQQSATSSQTSQQTSQQTTSQTSSQTSQQTSQQTSSTTTSASTQPVPAGYILVAALSSLAGKTSAYFKHPSRGLSILVNLSGQWNAFSATCTHAPCTVQVRAPSIYCPCHDGYFDPNNGAVQRGPPPRPLPQIGVLVQDNNLYVSA